jgi:ammonium transporter, Amt family
LIEGNAALLWTQIQAAVIVAVYCAAITFAILYVLEKAMGLRVDKQTEIEGLDLNLHGEVVP